MLIGLAIALAKAKPNSPNQFGQVIFHQVPRLNEESRYVFVLIFMGCHFWSASQQNTFDQVNLSIYSGIDVFTNHVWNHTTPPANRLSSLAWPRRPCVNCLVRLVTEALSPGSASEQERTQGETVGFLGDFQPKAFTKVLPAFGCLL